METQGSSKDPSATVLLGRGDFERYGRAGKAV
jgi:hypothetical protein